MANSYAVNRSYVPFRIATPHLHIVPITMLAQVNQCHLQTFRRNVPPEKSAALETAVNVYSITRHAAVFT